MAHFEPSNVNNTDNMKTVNINGFLPSNYYSLSICWAIML